MKKLIKTGKKMQGLAYILEFVLLAGLITAVYTSIDPRIIADNFTNLIISAVSSTNFSAGQNT